MEWKFSLRAPDGTETQSYVSEQTAFRLSTLAAEIRAAEDRVCVTAALIAEPTRAFDGANPLKVQDVIREVLGEDSRLLRRGATFTTTVAQVRELRFRLSGLGVAVEVTPLTHIAAAASGVGLD